MHVCRLSHSADPRTPGGPPSRPAVRAWPERAPAWWRCRRCAACTGPPRGTPGRRAAGTGAASCSARPWSGCRWLSAGGGGVSTAGGAEGTLQPRCSLCAAPSRESKHGMRERGRGKGAGPQPPPTALDWHRAGWRAAGTEQQMTCSVTMAPLEQEPCSPGAKQPVNGALNLGGRCCSPAGRSSPPPSSRPPPAPGSAHRTQPRGELVRRRLHDADQSGDQPHLHGALTGLHLGQLLENVLSQRSDDRVWGGQGDMGPRPPVCTCPSPRGVYGGALTWCSRPLSRPGGPESS